MSESQGGAQEVPLLVVGDLLLALLATTRPLSLKPKRRARAVVADADAGDQSGDRPRQQAADAGPVAVAVVVGHGEDVADDQHRQQDAGRGLASENGRKQGDDNHHDAADAGLGKADEQRGRDNHRELPRIHAAEESCPLHCFAHFRSIPS